MAGYKHLEIVSDFEKYVKDKKSSAVAYYRYLLARMLRMFQYKNLPDTIPHEVLDRYLFEYGIACITKVNDKLFVFSGNLGGPQDVYYRPTEFIISNPHLKVGGDIFTANVQVFDNLGQPIEADNGSNSTGVLIRNDSEWIGLHPLLARYAFLLSENTLTLRTADVMLRIIALLSAKTDDEKRSAEEYLKAIENGKLAVIGESAFHEGVNMQSPPSNNGSYLTQFIEYQQYLKGSFFNEIGLSANYNMKREAIGKGESTLDEDALLPLCDNMLKTRKEDIARINKMYGTEIEVEFSSSWLMKRIEDLASLKELGQPTSFSIPQPNELGQPSEDGSVVANDTQNECNIASSDEAKCPQNSGNIDAGDEGIDGIEGTEGTEGTGNPESEINDKSLDEELVKILNDLVNQEPSKPLTMEDMDNDDEEGDEEDVSQTTDN